MALVTEDHQNEAISIYLGNKSNLTMNLSSIREKVLKNTSKLDHNYSIVSYSKNVFIPVTRLCSDYCSYCAFRLSQQKIPDRSNPFLSEKYIVNTLRNAKELGCSEVLFTLGQSPELKYSIAREWLESHGYRSTIEYIRHLCEVALDIGLLPHSNPGIMNKSEFQTLKMVNASMGLMLETTNQQLFDNPNGPHHYAPSKQPRERLQTLIIAGEEQHPFTTGLLLGIGETQEDRINALLAIKDLHEKYNHIQEVILQPFTPHSNTKWANKHPFSIDDLLNIVLVASILLPNIPLQVPPNLRQSYSKFLKAGCRDFGGISPLSIDYVNPENLWPTIYELKKAVKEVKLNLKERLAVYPRFLTDFPNKWISRMIMETIKKHNLADPNGYRAE